MEKTTPTALHSHFPVVHHHLPEHYRRAAAVTNQQLLRQPMAKDFQNKYRFKQINRCTGRLASTIPTRSLMSNQQRESEEINHLGLTGVTWPCAHKYEECT